jgi:predicted acetyltransferase
VTDLIARPLSDAEWIEYRTLVAHAFLTDPDPDSTIAVRDLFPGDRFLGVSEPGGRLVGGGGIQTRDMTLVGGRPTPVAAVSYVGVRPDARGRGALSTLMRAQLDGLHETGAEPVAVLWASQAPIYGRFGYGVATWCGELNVDARARFMPGIRYDGEVRWLTRPEAEPVLAEVHSTVAARRVGWLNRTPPNWRWWLFDSNPGHSWTTQRYAVHRGADGAPDGYAAFHTRANWPASGAAYDLSIKELVAATPEAHAALWRNLLDLDLVAHLHTDRVAPDDPLTGMLLDPRPGLTNVRDGIWVRLVDLDRALVARSYGAECGLVVEVTDRFCPWNAGRWRLDVSPDAASIERTTAEPDLACDIADLGAAYLGGTRLTALAAAGRVRELRDGAVLRASRAFAGDVEPHCPEVF